MAKSNVHGSQKSILFAFSKTQNFRREIQIGAICGLQVGYAAKLFQGEGREV